ncbi:ribosomal protein S18 acetylase RimI-like enzyme [Sphingomonas kaistensis]|uniref:Ribosomal protein S18 acetylase RimI-like enzyme n=1 Tax=Sphingomonas kaistensis TaxID=298708 RepID=A0A7X5Y4Q2_9SPHN|nr:GNAT family N-acetyltransferase [Sphingomonas kaistensis]NJC05056.1 ribosomal protein S18 acetylase RimI-like enzyme [Sphingomonas kaistensis]
MTIRPATAADLAAIDQVFRTTFCDTFAHLYDPADLSAFLGRFTPEAWAEEFADPAIAFQVGEADGKVVGFAKIGPNKLPHVAPGDVIELKQLYLLKSAHGSGLARALIDWAQDEARRRGASRMALSVFSENWRAQAFYKRCGFEDRGPVTFMVGNHPDEDRVWEAAL